MGKRALIYGRFQPFHLGHLKLSLWTLERFEEIVYLIGMASESYTLLNPFTAGERITMIRLALQEYNVDLSKTITATIPTLEIGMGSVSTVLSYVPSVDALVTRNYQMKRIFEDYGMRVIVPPAFDRDRLRGEAIRDLMLKQDPEWKRRVPRSVVEYIEGIGGVQRVIEIAKKDYP